MKHAKIIFAGAALLLSACNRQPEDPNAPVSHIDTATPAWAETLRVDVRKRGADVWLNGRKIAIDRETTDLGGGRSAVRDMWDLYVTDETGVQCNWNSSEQIEWCRRPNPALGAYLNAKNNAGFSALSALN